jgi:hypothetical protein
MLPLNGEETNPVSVYDELLAKVDAAKSGKFIDVWQLHCFLDEHSGLDLYLASGAKLSELEPNLTDKEMREARMLGCTFPEDWENPKEYFGGKDDS